MTSPSFYVKEMTGNFAAPGKYSPSAESSDLMFLVGWHIGFVIHCWFQWNSLCVFTGVQRWAAMERLSRSQMARHLCRSGSRISVSCTSTRNVYCTSAPKW